MQIRKDSSVWYNAVVRGDAATAIIGERTNIQDLACLQVGDNCIIGAGALVTENTVIPDGSMAFGSPAKVITDTAFLI